MPKSGRRPIAGVTLPHAARLPGARAACGVTASRAVAPSGLGPSAAGEPPLLQPYHGSGAGQVPGMVVMEIASADAVGGGGGGGGDAPGVSDPAYRRLLYVINARRQATLADWPAGAAALELHPLQARARAGRQRQGGGQDSRRRLRERRRQREQWYCQQWARAAGARPASWAQDAASGPGAWLVPALRCRGPCAPAPCLQLNTLGMPCRGGSLCPLACQRCVTKVSHTSARQAASADEMTRGARVDTARRTVEVPPLTAVVFVEPR